MTGWDAAGSTPNQPISRGSFACAPCSTSSGSSSADVITAVAQAITIIGIPLAIANLKMIPISLFPYGKQIVPTDSLSAAQRPLHSF